MKIIIYLFGVLLTIGIIFCMWTAKRDNQQPEKLIYSVDTLYITKYDTLYVNNLDTITYLNDKIDSLKSENFILKYKLGRVEEYNKISNKGNNIKYLRGWINRVLYK